MLNTERTSVPTKTLPLFGMKHGKEETLSIALMIDGESLVMTMLLLASLSLTMKTTHQQPLLPSSLLLWLCTQSVVSYLSAVSRPVVGQPVINVQLFSRQDVSFQSKGHSPLHKIFCRDHVDIPSNWRFVDPAKGRGGLGQDPESLQESKKGHAQGLARISSLAKVGETPVLAGGGIDDKLVIGEPPNVGQTPRVVPKLGRRRVLLKGKNDAGVGAQDGSLGKILCDKQSQTGSRNGRGLDAKASLLLWAVCFERYGEVTARSIVHRDESKIGDQGRSDPQRPQVCR
mmetsp:Transcript_22703/g.47610  ORF Transcript_22703/g.47610 Transcript_22703/m.47610 type:complete len:287 (+) Transcript_22703:362-1222(+)